MPLLLRVKYLLAQHFSTLKWKHILLGAILYALVSWLLLRACGEQALLPLSNFLYWLVVTASTVGYGDYSPTTTGGKYVVSFFVIPVGLSLFGLVIGRLAAVVSSQWRKGVRGLKSLDYKDHILVIGWNETKTLRLLQLLLREIKYHTESRQIALCVRAEIENPMPGKIGFVKVDSFSNDEEMGRAAIDSASCIIIDNPDDEVTIATALYCSGRNPNTQIIAYFHEENLGKILARHCSNVEVMPSVAVEMIAKSAMDPGSSMLLHELLNVESGMTQYSIRYQGTEATTVRVLFQALKEKHEATLIGLSGNGPQAIQLNPSLGTLIKPSDTVYYIADERIGGVDWQALEAK